MRRFVLRWELVGIIVISVLGSVLHFVFEWFGEWDPVGVIAAVNESVWEHLKLAFWPAVFYAVLEYRYLKRLTNNFFLAKACGTYVMPISIVTLFYAYTAAVGHEILAADILIFWLAVALGQLASYRMLTSHVLPEWSNVVGLALVVFLAIAFVVFTFYPPHLPIFMDPVTGGYGILK